MAEVLLPYGFVGLLGASVGSFINVVVYRLPAGSSLISPPSRCPSCHTRLRIYDNLPVLGWLLLRGRCRYCRCSISRRYPLVELGTALLYGVVFLCFGWSLETPVYWLFTSWLVALTLIDLDTLTLPNALTASGTLLGWAAQAGLAFDQNHAVVTAVAGSVGASILGLWLFDAIALLGAVALNTTAMGGGDAKLAALLGAWLGWRGLLLSLFLAALSGTVAGLAGIASGRLRRQQPIPFGPFLALGAGISLFLGNTLIQAYLNLFWHSPVGP